MNTVKTAIAKLSENTVRIAHHHDVLLENCEKLVERQAEIISVYSQKVDAPLMIEYMANQIEINKSLLIMLKNCRNRDVNGVR